jgi:hypothetical protein
VKNVSMKKGLQAGLFENTKGGGIIWLQAF